MSLKSSEKILTSVSHVPQFQTRFLHGPSVCIHHTVSLEVAGAFMLRIETELDGRGIVLRLIGRIRSDCIEELRQQIQHRAAITALDLAEVNLVDLPSVRFLRECQDQRIELRNCAPYIQEWIRRERVEE